jgi:hypothetical protein
MANEIGNDLQLQTLKDLLAPSHTSNVKALARPVYAAAKLGSMAKASW